MVKTRITFLLFVLTLFMSTSLLAQATRTWVSGVGDDVNPCSRTAPCKTFAGAISKTAAGGIINVLDQGAFGAVTVTKSITIDGTPMLAGVLASGTSGININAATTDTIILRNLDIEGAGTTLGTRGIRIYQAGTVIVDHCKIFSFSDRAISVETSQPVKIHVTDSRVYGNFGNGIVLEPFSGAVVMTATIERTVIANNVKASPSGVGLSTSGGSRVTVTDSVISGNTTGVRVQGATGLSIVNLIRTTVSDNGVGLLTDSGVGALIRLHDVALFNNTTAGYQIAAGQIASYQDNTIAGNGPNMGVLASLAKN